MRQRKQTIGETHKKAVWDAVERYAEAQSQLDLFNAYGSGRAQGESCERELAEARAALRHLLGMPEGDDV